MKVRLMSASLVEGGVRSEFSVDDLRGSDIVSPKIGPAPDFFNRLLNAPRDAVDSRRPSVADRFQYAVEVSDGGKFFTATATGDLDENGVNVMYTVSNAQPAAIKSPADEY